MPPVYRCHPWYLDALLYLWLCLDRPIEDTEIAFTSGFDRLALCLEMSSY